MLNPQVAGSLSREPRSCVLRQRQERTPLQRMLDHLLKAIEKKDPQQFFAWPVTDNIAPGYSSIISQPMDFSTMRQKAEDGAYASMQEFLADFRLMCTNAMEYNHVDTVYYKASKKLLHAGLKIMQPEKLGWLFALCPDVTATDLGFEIPLEFRHEHSIKSDPDSEDAPASSAKRKMPASKFEAVPDDLEPHEVLARAQIAAREARAKLVTRRGGPSMGFLRQRKDGTTHLNILVGGDGVIPGTKKRPVLLGTLTGKISEGTGQLQGFREDRRNLTKPVKPLYYGAFGSYAPSYDSAFANLTKEESDLVYQTYGSEAAVQYSESILDFAKDCDYTVWMVDSLLDLLTGGEHSKTKRVLDERKKLREEEEAVKTIMEARPHDGVRVDVEDLRTLAESGIDVHFLETMEEDIRLAEERHELQMKLDNMSRLLERLNYAQNQRLSQPLPTHLSQVPGPTDDEATIADSITDHLSDIAKRVPPGDVASVAGLRKAMGVAVPESEAAAAPGGANEVSDLESELRMFLESEPSLAHSPLRDDKTIEEILME